MTKRNKESKKEIAERLRREKFRRRMFGALGAVVLVGVLLFAVLSYHPNKDYLVCTSTEQLAEHTHTYVYIGLGNQTDFTSQFIRIADNMGITPQCAWSVHTHSGSGERTEHYVNMHVEATEVHTFTANDIFRVWGYSLGHQSQVYFAPDGVSSYRGHVSVYLYPASYPGDSLPMPQDPAYLWGGDVRNAPLREGDWMYIHVEYPYSNGANGFA